MIPHSQPRKPRNSSKVNLLISVAFHALLVVVVLYFAARTGLLGEKIQKITVTMEKPPVKPPEPPKVEPPKELPKPEPPKLVETPKVEAPKAAAAPPVVAPPVAELPSFDFAGGKLVQSSSDPVQLYKGLLEYTLRSQWNRPEDVADDTYVVEVEVAVDPAGNLSEPRWQKGSGDKRWDDSVRSAVAAVTRLNRPPPTNFPPRVTIRFDVQADATEPLLP